MLALCDLIFRAAPDAFPDVAFTLVTTDAEFQGCRIVAVSSELTCIDFTDERLC